MIDGVVAVDDVVLELLIGLHLDAGEQFLPAQSAIAGWATISRALRIPAIITRRS